MSDDTPIQEGGQGGLTRRELLRKGGVLGGALAWSIPTVQTFGMAPAFAAATSFAISYVAAVAECGGEFFRGKWEVVDGTTSLKFEGGGRLPCESGKSKEWPTVDPGYSGGSPPGGGWITDYDGTNVVITVQGDCQIVWTLNKCGPTCIVKEGLSQTSVTFEPCPNDGP